MILKLRNFFAFKAAARIVAAPVIVGLGFVCVLQINAHYKQDYGVSYDFWAFVAMVFLFGLGIWMVQNACSSWRAEREVIDRFEAIKVRPNYWNVMQSLRARKLYQRIYESNFVTSPFEFPVLSVVASLLGGADPNAVYKGRPIIAYVHNAKHAKWLAWAGADVNVICDRGEGTGVLNGALTADNVALAQEWLIAGANPNAVDNDGCTPLFHARSAEMERLLLIHGADPTIRNKKGGLAQEKNLTWRKSDFHSDLVAAAEEIRGLRKGLLID